MFRTLMVLNPDRVKVVEDVKIKQPHLYFSDLFNSYSQSINKQENRSGQLFSTPFKRIKVDNESYFRQLVIYIHSNPIKHGFTESCIDYPWSSYSSILSISKSKIEREKVIGWFDDKANFINVHKSKTDFNISEELILE